MFNPFHATGLFLNPPENIGKFLKTRSFLIFSVGIERDLLREKRLLQWNEPFRFTRKMN